MKRHWPSFFILIIVFLICLFRPETIFSQKRVIDIREIRDAYTGEIKKTTEISESLIPPEARNPDGTVNKDHPAYKEAKQMWQDEMAKIRKGYNSLDNRWDTYQNTIKEQGLTENIVNTGSQPKSVKSDMDFTAKDYGSGKKLADALIKEQGHKVVELPDRWVDKTTDTAIWKPEPGSKSVASKLSSSYDASVSSKAQPGSDAFPTEGGMHQTSKGAIGVKDVFGDVLSNANKASDAGLTGNPESMDTHIVGKSAVKAGEAAGITDRNQSFYDKATGVKNHLTPEEAGITTFGNSPEVKKQELANFQNEAKSEVTKAYNQAKNLSDQLNNTLTDQAKAEIQAGNKEGAIKIKTDQIQSKISNQVTMTEIANKDPQLAADLAGKKIEITITEDGATVIKDLNTGKTMTPSEFKEGVTKGTRSQIVETVNPPEIKPGTVETPAGKTPVEEVKPGTKGMSTGMKIAGGALLIYQGYEGIKEGFKAANEEGKPDDSSFKTYTKGAIYSVGYTLGIPQSWQMGKQAGDEAMDQYNKEKAEGKDPSLVAAKLKGMAVGVGSFIKALTWDQLAAGAEAVKEGVGLVKDTYDVYKGEKTADETKEWVKAKKEQKESQNYNPLDDPNLKSKDKPVDVAQVDKLSDDFKKGQWPKGDAAKKQKDQTVIQQPEGYTSTGKPSGETTGDKTQQPPYPPPGTIKETDPGKTAADFIKGLPPPKVKEVEAKIKPSTPPPASSPPASPPPTKTEDSKNTPEKPPEIKKRGPAGSSSGTFPAELFNGLQIVYTISGPQLNQPKDSPGFTHTRAFEGQLASNTLTVSGTGIYDSPAKYDTEYGSFYGVLSVTVSAGKNAKNYSYTQPKGAGPMRQTFSVSVPIPDDATSGSFSISVTFVNPRFGNRGVVVSGNLK